MKEEFGIKFLFTSRLNQDVLENFFSKVRALGNNNSPNSIDFLVRVRLILFGVNPDALFNRPSVDQVEQQKIIKI